MTGIASTRVGDYVPGDLVLSIDVFLDSRTETYLSGDLTVRPQGERLAGLKSVSLIWFECGYPDVEEHPTPDVLSDSLGLRKKAGSCRCRFAAWMICERDGKAED